MSGVKGLVARPPSGLAYDARLHRAAPGCTGLHEAALGWVEAEFERKQPEALVNHAVAAIEKRAF